MKTMVSQLTSKQCKSDSRLNLQNIRRHLFGALLLVLSMVVFSKSLLATTTETEIIICKMGLSYNYLFGEFESDQYGDINCTFNNKEELVREEKDIVLSVIKDFWKKKTSQVFPLTSCVRQTDQETCLSSEDGATEDHLFLSANPMFNNRFFSLSDRKFRFDNKTKQQQDTLENLSMTYPAQQFRNYYIFLGSKETQTTDGSNFLSNYYLEIDFESFEAFKDLGAYKDLGACNDDEANRMPFCGSKASQIFRSQVVLPITNPRSAVVTGKISDLIYLETLKARLKQYCTEKLDKAEADCDIATWLQRSLDYIRETYDLSTDKTFLQEFCTTVQDRAARDQTQLLYVVGDHVTYNLSQITRRFGQTIKIKATPLQSLEEKESSSILLQFATPLIETDYKQMVFFPNKSSFNTKSIKFNSTYGKIYWRVFGQEGQSLKSGKLDLVSVTKSENLSQTRYFLDEHGNLQSLPSLELSYSSSNGSSSNGMTVGGGASFDPFGTSGAIVFYSDELQDTFEKLEDFQKKKALPYFENQIAIVYFDIIPSDTELNENVMNKTEYREIISYPLELIKEQMAAAAAAADDGECQSDLNVKISRLISVSRGREKNDWGMTYQEDKQQMSCIKSYKGGSQVSGGAQQCQVGSVNHNYVTYAWTFNKDLVTSASRRANEGIRSDTSESEGHTSSTQHSSGFKGSFLGISFGHQNTRSNSLENELHRSIDESLNKGGAVSGSTTDAQTSEMTLRLPVPQLFKRIDKDDVTTLPTALLKRQRRSYTFSCSGEIDLCAGNISSECLVKDCPVVVFNDFHFVDTMISTFQNACNSDQSQCYIPLERYCTSSSDKLCRPGPSDSPSEIMVEQKPDVPNFSLSTEALKMIEYEDNRKSKWLASYILPVCDEDRISVLIKRCWKLTLPKACESSSFDTESCSEMTTGLLSADGTINTTAILALQKKLATGSLDDLEKKLSDAFGSVLCPELYTDQTDIATCKDNIDNYVSFAQIKDSILALNPCDQGQCSESLIGASPQLLEENTSRILHDVLPRLQLKKPLVQQFFKDFVKTSDFISDFTNIYLHQHLLTQLFLSLYSREAVQGQLASFLSVCEKQDSLEKFNCALKQDLLASLREALGINNLLAEQSASDASDNIKGYIASGAWDNFDKDLMTSENKIRNAVDDNITESIGWITDLLDPDNSPQHQDLKAIIAEKGPQAYQELYTLTNEDGSGRLLPNGVYTTVADEVTIEAERFESGVRARPYLFEIKNRVGEDTDLSSIFPKFTGTNFTNFAEDDSVTISKLCGRFENCCLAIDIDNSSDNSSPPKLKAYSCDDSDSKGEFFCVKATLVDNSSPPEPSFSYSKATSNAPSRSFEDWLKFDVNRCESNGTTYSPRFIIKELQGETTALTLKRNDSLSRLVESKMSGIPVSHYFDNITESLLFGKVLWSQPPLINVLNVLHKLNGSSSRIFLNLQFIKQDDGTWTIVTYPEYVPRGGSPRYDQVFAERLGLLNECFSSGKDYCRTISTHFYTTGRSLDVLRVNNDAVTCVLEKKEECPLLWAYQALSPIKVKQGHGLLETGTKPSSRVGEPDYVFYLDKDDGLLKDYSLKDYSLNNLGLTVLPDPQDINSNYKLTVFEPVQSNNVVIDETVENTSSRSGEGVEGVKDENLDAFVKAFSDGGNIEVWTKAYSGEWDSDSYKTQSDECSASDYCSTIDSYDTFMMSLSIAIHDMEESDLTDPFGSHEADQDPCGAHDSIMSSGHLISCFIRDFCSSTEDWAQAQDQASFSALCGEEGSDSHASNDPDNTSTDPDDTSNAVNTLDDDLDNTSNDPDSTSAYPDNTSNAVTSNDVTSDAVRRLDDLVKTSDEGVRFLIDFVQAFSNDDYDITTWQQAYSGTLEPYHVCHEEDLDDEYLDDDYVDDDYVDDDYVDYDYVDDDNVDDVCQITDYKSFMTSLTRVVDLVFGEDSSLLPLSDEDYNQFCQNTTDSNMTGPINNDEWRNHNEAMTSLLQRCSSDPQTADEDDPSDNSLITEEEQTPRRFVQCFVSDLCVVVDDDDNDDDESKIFD